MLGSGGYSRPARAHREGRKALWPPTDRRGQPLFVRLMDELSEANRATAWAGTKEALRPFEGLAGFVASSEALMAIGVA